MPKKTTPAEKTKESRHWAERLAEEVIERFPDRREYVCAAGISPSGVVHFGNFRDVMTIVAVGRALEQQGKRVKLLFSWDDYDRFRKVPAGVDPAKFEQHLGKPLSEVPDPHGDTGVSYANRFERLFEGAMQELGITLEYRRQSELYRFGTYDAAIRTAVEQRADIARILLDLMSDKAKTAKGITDEEFIGRYYPVSIYSEFTGKDATEILGYEDGRFTYRCKETDQEGTVEIGTDRNLKLAWKVDWPMRWQHEGVAFEPAGSDHLSPGSSYDAGSRIVREVFGGEPPVTARYGMVGLQGVAGKMSGSTGLAKSPNELLEVYTEPLLKWQYLKRQPRQNFSLAFDTEIFRQYDEFDREIAACQDGSLDGSRRFALEAAFPERKVPDAKARPIPFRQLVGYGQIVQWDEGKLDELLGSLELAYDPESVKARLPRARGWLENHNPDQLITLLQQPNAAYGVELSDEAKRRIGALRERLSEDGKESIQELEELVYAIPKDPKASDEENKKAQRAFFRDVYQLLIGKDTGPRLSTFLWAVDREKVHELLEA
ncbi:MAG: lysine--tRNA ligase [Patescibacteria group bacterium]